MRQIKFRECDPEREKMYGKGHGMSYSDRLESDNATMFVFDHEESDDNREEEKDVNGVPFRRLMQYTGLHDKNGREIYEGDIIEGVFGSRHEVRRNERPKGYKHIGKVGIVDGSVVFWPRPVENGRRMNYPGVPLTGGQRKYIYDDEIAGADSTVLGNIYENPELMEVAEHD